MRDGVQEKEAELVDGNDDEVWPAEDVPSVFAAACAREEARYLKVSVYVVTVVAFSPAVCCISVRPVFCVCACACV